MTRENTAESLTPREGEVLPAPSSRRVDLHDAEAIRREMAAVYRDMRSKKIESQDGSRLVFVLSALRQAYETDVLEKRVRLLEGRTIYGKP